MILPKEIADRLHWHTEKKQPGDPDWIERIDHEPKPCEDCGQTVVDRRIDIKGKMPHLEKRIFLFQCSICKNFKNPKTGVYDCTRREAESCFKR